MPNSGGSHVVFTGKFSKRGVGMGLDTGYEFSRIQFPPTSPRFFRRECSSVTGFKQTIYCRPSYSETLCCLHLAPSSLHKLYNSLSQIQ
jgi:hypothetical protein